MRHIMVTMVLFLTSVAPVLAVSEVCSSDRLSAVIGRFESPDGSPLEMLLKLGQEEGVRIAVESIDTSHRETRPAISITDSSVGQIIKKIFEGIVPIEIEQLDGVVTLRRDPDPPPPELAVKIAGFVGERAPMQLASHGLFLQLMLIRDPSIAGFAGRLPPGDRSDLVGPFEDPSASLRSILNRILCTSKRGGMWIWRGSHRRAGEPEWIMLGYSEGFEVNRAKLGALWR